MNEPKVNLLDLLAALNAGRRLIIGGTLIICILTAGFTFLLPKEYETFAQLLPPKEQKKGFGFADLLSDLPIPSLRLGEKGTPADIFVATLKSPATHRNVVEKFNLMEIYEVERMTDAVEILALKTTVDKSEEGTITISLLDQDPERAAAITNYYVEVLDNTNRELTQTVAQERLEFIRQLLQREDDKLGDVMQKLQEFQSAHNAISIEDQAKAVINAAAAMQMAAMDLMMTRNVMLSSGLSLNHPRVRELDEQISQRHQVLRILRDGENSDAKDLKGFSSLKEKSIELHLEENLFLPLRRIPEVALDYANIEKEVLVQKALMQMLLQQEAEALIEASNPTSTVQVLDWAIPPEIKARPQRFLITFIAGILSFFASVAYTLGSVYVRALKARWDAEYRKVD